jgi:uncharacterized protein
MSSDVVGRVTGLFRYPVKSMAAESLETIEVDWHGLAGDRRWSFIRDGQLRSDFPWLTARERSDLVRHHARFLDPSEPEDSAVVVRTPEGVDYEVTDPALADRLGPGVRLIKQNRGVFDAAPISLISLQTVAALGGLVGREITGLRFRPNLLVDLGEDGEAFGEEAWVGATITVGGLRMRVDRRDKRCVMVNIDPESAERDPAVLRAVAQQRESRAGVYGTPVAPGPVSVGDPVTVDAK